MTGSPTAAAAKPPFDAVIFDLDGVVTNTAVVHQAAWKDAFDRIFHDPRMPAGANRAPLTRAEYLTFIDGMPREDGVVRLLAARGAEIGRGAETDAPGAWTGFGLGAWKNELFHQHLRRDGVQSYPGTLELLQRLAGASVPTAVVTSSRNAAPVLEAAGIRHLFTVVMDGATAAGRGLRGKPAPDVFLAAAAQLGVAPPHAVVIEDSAAGVEAGRRGGFGMVVGIDRSGSRRQLEAAGARIVLNDVGELDLGLVIGNAWHLVYEGVDAGHEGHREALTTLGNGYMGVRGAAPEGGPFSYAGMYLAGVYNRVTVQAADEMLIEEHMVNAPDCLPLDLRIAGLQWWSDGALAVVRERRVLDLRRAVLERRLLLEGADRRRIEVVQVRFVSMAEPHLLALETTITALGWSGAVEVRSGINAGVRNANLPERAQGSDIHLADLTPSRGTAAELPPDALSVVEVQTTQSLIRIAAAYRTRTSVAAEPVGDGGSGPFHYRTFRLFLTPGTPARLTKTVAVVTSRDRAISSPETGARAVLERAGDSFAGLLASHEEAWRRELRPFLVEIDAPVQVRLVLNLHIFHLLQTLTRHTAELDAGVTARGLHGEGYRGHVFWDELFVLPVLTSRTPAVARSVIEYRWRRLPAARHAAAAAGLAGAKFPWQSGSDGTEETPKWLYNDRSGRWVRDYSHLQVHSGLAVAFNAWQYFQATGDKIWLLQKGAELVIEVARFFRSLAVFDPRDGRYHLRGVVGPDEYHTGYPGRPEPGLDDNAYTNVMAAWVCLQAADILRYLHGSERAGLMDSLGVAEEEAAGWEAMGAAMYVPFHRDGVISQFEGYEQLRELDWEHYRDAYGDILFRRLDGDESPTETITVPTHLVERGSGEIRFGERAGD